MGLRCKQIGAHSNFLDSAGPSFNHQVMETTSSMQTITNLKTAIETFKLGMSGPVLVNYARQALALNHRSFGEKNIEVGTTKFAGQPDVPADFKWPKHKRRPLGFVAQIELKPNASVFPDLPNEGILSFFYDVIGVETGEDHHGKGNCAVYWFNETLVRTKNPTRIAEEWETCPVGLSCDSILSIPGISAREMPELSHNEYESFVEFWNAVVRGRTKGSVGHQFGGHADDIQGDMRSECAERTKTAPEDWNLLLQVGSDPEIPFQWDDSGALYYWIRNEDLKERDFSKVICIEQCY